MMALAGHFGRGDELGADSTNWPAPCPFTIAFAVNFGWRRCSSCRCSAGSSVHVSSLLMASIWLAVIGLLIASYSLAYLYKYRFDRLGGARPVVIGLVCLLLLAIGFIYVNNFTLIPAAVLTRYFDHPDGFLLNLADRTLWPRYLPLHAQRAGHRRPGPGPLPHLAQAEDAEVQIRRGCRWFTHATLLNVVVGLWFTAVLPKGC